MTQKGFRANFSLPLHPRYRQQHPADQILTMYSTPNTTIITISFTHTGRQAPSGNIAVIHDRSHNIHSLATLIGTPELLLIHAIIESSNHMSDM